MANCTYCNSFILFKGVKVGEYNFCNSNCLQKAHHLALSRQIPESTVLETIQHLNATGCPKCKRPGEIDVHTSHTIWSALILTSWRSKPEVSCRSCGIKSQLGNAALSGVVGWWGFPWGLIMTPVQIGRNVAGIFKNIQHPSPQLKQMIALNIAAQMAAQQAAQQKLASTPPPFNPQGSA